MEKIYFYAPDQDSHQFFRQESPPWMEISKARNNRSGSSNGNFVSWIITTHFHVKQAGLSCEVVDDIPKKGIVIADRGTLGNQYPYFGEAMLICAKGDGEFHPSAHLHIVHNPSDLQIKRNLLWNPYYIPHWPQPSLIPRSRERSFILENVAFIGSRSNLAKVFLSDDWIHSIDALGCKWHPVFNQKDWNDYSNIDVIVGVRRFDRCTYLNKPASKLINCWRAGVPAILAPESAFIALRKSELDFLIVHSIDEAIEAVKRLKNNPELYLAMVENGIKRAEEFREEIITESWINFFHTCVTTQYEKWQKMSEFERRILFAKRNIRLKLDRMQTRINKISPFNFS